MSNLESIQSKLSSFLLNLGMECHPFLVGWYNERVSSKFQLDFPKDALAFVIISKPSFFENAFLPFVKGAAEADLREPVDKCVVQVFEKAKDMFEDHNNIHCMLDFELTATRRPKVSMQTAAKVAEAVAFFGPDQVSGEVMKSADIKSKNVYPVCLHPKYGGWMALRGIMIFGKVLLPDLKVSKCQIEMSEQQIANLLKLFNDHWRDERYRDVIEVEQRYSEMQRSFFKLLPAQRLEMIKRIREESE